MSIYGNASSGGTLALGILFLSEFDPEPSLLVWNDAVRKIRGDSGKGVSWDEEATGEMGRGRKVADCV